MASGTCGIGRGDGHRGSEGTLDEHRCVVVDGGRAVSCGCESQAAILSATMCSFATSHMVL